MPSTGSLTKPFWAIAAGVVPAVVIAAVFEFLPMAGGRAKLSLVLLLAAIAAGALRARSTLLAAPYRTLVPILLGVTVAIAAAMAVRTNQDSLSYTLAWTVGPTLAGWAILFWLLPGRDSAPADAVPWEPPRWAMPALLAATATLLTVVHQLSVGRWFLVSDETIYVLQSLWMGEPGYAWHIDRELLPFFVMRKLGVTPGGGIFGMYTPGWPALLALFDAIGLRWWSGIILGTASVYVTYRLGLHLHSRAAGVIAAVLLATNPLFLLLHAGYMAHAATILCIALAALWLLEGEGGSGWTRGARWGGAGVALAIAVTVRSLTGVALGLSLALWLVVRRRMSMAEMVRCAATVILAALPVAAWFLHYNQATTGSPFLLSYQALHGTGYDLGFGTRGFTTIDEQLRRTQIPMLFTPGDAVTNLLSRLAGINFGFFAYALFAPLLVVFAAYRHTPRWLTVAIFLVLPLLHFFYWGSDIRFYSEYLPFLFVWGAAGVLAVARHSPALAMRLVAALVASNAVLSVPERWDRIPLDEPWQNSAYRISPARVALFEQLDATARARGKLLVFVHEQVPGLDNLIDRLYQFNARGFDSDVLVARDLGERNATLIARFPDRIPLLVIDRGRTTPADVAELPRRAVP